MFKLSKDNLNFRPFVKEEATNEIKKLPADIYRLHHSNSIFGSDTWLRRVDIFEKYIVPKKDENFNKILRIVDNTFNIKLNELYTDMQYTNKSGIILHGPPGTGKTVTASLVAKQMIDKYDAVVFMLDEDSMSPLSSVIAHIRQETPNRPILCILDEMDNYGSYMEAQLVDLLDSHKSINNFCFIGITNYYDRVSNKFKNRPSRIKLDIEITNVTYDVIKSLILEKVPTKWVGFIEVDKIAYQYSQEGKTMDQVKQSILTILEEKVLEVVPEKILQEPIN